MRILELLPVRARALLEVARVSFICANRLEESVVVAAGGAEVIAPDWDVATIPFGLAKHHLRELDRVLNVAQRVLAGRLGKVLQHLRREVRANAEELSLAPRVAAAELVEPLREIVVELRRGRASVAALRLLLRERHALNRAVCEVSVHIRLEERLDDCRRDCRGFVVAECADAEVGGHHADHVLRDLLRRLVSFESAKQLSRRAIPRILDDGDWRSVERYAVDVLALAEVERVGPRVLVHVLAVLVVAVRHRLYRAFYEAYCERSCGEGLALLRREDRLVEAHGRAEGGV